MHSLVIYLLAKTVPCNFLMYNFFIGCFFKLKLLGWHWLIKLYRLRVYSSTIHQPQAALCSSPKVKSPSATIYLTLKYWGPISDTAGLLGHSPCLCACSYLCLLSVFPFGKRFVLTRSQMLPAPMGLLMYHSFQRNHSFSPTSMHCSGVNLHTYTSSRAFY